LKQAVADIVPADLLYAPKRGFGFGVNHSELLLGSWRNKVDEAVRAMSSDHWLNRRWVTELWRRVQNGTGETSLFARIFTILAWEQALC